MKKHRTPAPTQRTRQPVERIAMPCWPAIIVAADMFGPDRQAGALEESMRYGRMTAVLALDEPQKARLRELLSTIEPSFAGTDGDHPVPFLPPRWLLRDVVEVIEREAPELIPAHLQAAAVP
jgi:hypothetical protein